MLTVQHNPRLLTLFQVGKASLFVVAILPLFFADQCGLNIREIMWLQAIFGLIIAVCEFPSGYLADRIGYRRTLLVGGVLVFAGWSAYPLAHDFWTLLVGEALLGVGLACVSGCDSALLYESLRAAGNSERFGPLISRQLSIAQLACGTAALGGAVLYATHPRLPFLVQLGATAVMLGATLRMVEPPRERVMRSGSHLSQAYGSIRDAVRAQPRLRAVLAMWTVLSLASYTPVWLFSDYARKAGVPVAWLGTLWALGDYVVAAGTLAGPRIRARLGLAGAGSLAVFALAAGYAGLSLSHALLGCTFYYAICWMRGLATALLTPEEHSLIPSRDRAALVSFRGLLFRLSFFGVGPLVGALVDAQGYHFTFAVFGGMLALCAAALLRPALGRDAVRRAAA